jgi:hypothetical protein
VTFIFDDRLIEAVLYTSEKDASRCRDLTCGCSDTETFHQYLLQVIVYEAKLPESSNCNQSPTMRRMPSDSQLRKFVVSPGHFSFKDT